MFDNNISYEKLTKLDEKQYEEVLSLQISKQNIIRIAKDCILNLEKNILKNYSLLICIDKVCPLKDNKIFDSKQLEEIFHKFKKEFIEYKKNSVLNPISKRYQNGKEEQKIDNLNILPKSEQIEKRLEFLKLIIKLQAELKQYNILKEILKYHLFLNQEQAKSIISQFIDEFVEREELINIEEIKLYEYLFLEFNYLENNLEYRIKDIKYDDFNYEIKLYEEIENIKYLNEFICSFSKQKDTDVIEEMTIFIFHFFNSTKNLKLLFKKCDDYLNESSDTSNIIDLCKYAINNSEKNYALKIKSLSSLCKKAIFKFTVKFNDKEKDLYFYGNTRINEINNYLNNNLKDFKNNDNEYFMLEYKDNKNSISLDEYDSNKTLNELNNNFDKSKKVKLEIIRKEIITKDELLDSNNNITERFNSILINWLKIFSKGKDKMNLDDIADWFIKLSGRKQPFFNKSKLEIIQFLKENSNVLEITLDEFKDFYKKACKDDINDVINNIKNMNLITEIPQEIENDKLPRFYLSNKIDENKEAYLWSLLFENFIFSLNEDVFDFISSLSVNEDKYNNILNNFKKDKNFTQRTSQYINNMYTLYIIESIIEDVEIVNSKYIIINKKEDQKEKILYKNIYSQKSKPFDDEDNIDKKNQFFIDFINSKYSDLVKYSSFILKKLNEDKENCNNNNLMVRCCIKCLDIINNIYNSYHNIYSKIDNNSNIINIKYKALKNIIENNNLSKNITDKSIYEEIIIQIIKYVDKCCYKCDNMKQGENNGIISKLKENCYILLFSLLYTNKEIFEVINKNEEIKKLFDKVLKDLYLNDNNKKNFGLLFITIFKQIKDKISDEFLSYLNDLIFIVFQEYIKSDKKKIENGFISFHFKLLINYDGNKENLKAKLEDNFKKICDKYYNFINHKNSNEKINGQILNNIIQDILTKYLDLKCLLNLEL